MCDWVQILSDRRSQGCLLLDAVGNAEEDGFAARLDESFARAGLHGTRCPVSLGRCRSGSLCFLRIFFLLMQVLVLLASVALSKLWLAVVLTSTVIPH